jgi:NAD(P)-dependent dehydrogenase (short-subunit alcohol dehydrogenase family)
MARQRAAGIAVVDRNRQTAEETAALVKNLGSEVLVIECNLRDRDQIQEAVDSAAAHFGGLDVLVNNAGIVETTMDPAVAEWELTAPQVNGAWARRRKSGSWSASWPPTTRRS